MEEDFIYSESRMRASTKFIIFTVVLLFIAGGIVFFFKSNNFNVKKTITYEVGDVISLDVKDYITNKPLNFDHYKLDIDSVVYDQDKKLTTVGEYTYRVTMKDMIKEGKIIVKDTKAPTVQTIDLTIGTNEKYEASDFIGSCVDYSLPCEYELDGTVDTTTAGEYKVRIKAKDNQGNVATTEAKLIVKEGYSLKEAKVKDLEPKYLEPSYDDWNKKYVVKYAGGLDPDDTENYRWNYYYQFLEANPQDYLDTKDKGKTIKNTEIIAVYNQYHYIIGFACRATLSDGTITYLTNGE